MRTWILSLLVVLSGCAHVGQDAASSGRVAALLNDAAFAPPAARIDTDGLFTLSPEMRRHLNSAQFKALIRTRGQPLWAHACALRPARPAARLRRDPHRHRRRNLCRAQGQLPLAGHHDGRLRPRNAHGRALPGSAARGHLEPRARPLPGQLARQPEPGAEGTGDQLRQRRPADHRFREAAAERQPARAPDRRRRHRGALHEQPRGRGTGAGTHQRGLLVGARRPAEKTVADGTPTIPWP